MNFYNPYFMPYGSIAPKAGFLSSLLGKINFSSILSGTGKTLNTINQVIPLVKQARPLMTNAKTMFKLMNEFNKGEIKETKTTPSTEAAVIENNTVETGPTFFL